MTGWHSVKVWNVGFKNGKINLADGILFDISVDESPRGVDIPGTLEESSIAGEEFQENTKDLPEKKTKVTDSVSIMSQPASGIKRKKMQKAQQSQASGPSSHSLSPLNSTDSLDDLGSSTSLPTPDVAFSQLHSIQDILNQLMSMQKEMQKQMSSAVAGPVNKEGKSVDGESWGGQC